MHKPQQGYFYQFQQICSFLLLFTITKILKYEEDIFENTFNGCSEKVICEKRTKDTMAVTLVLLFFYA